MKRRGWLWLLGGVLALALLADAGLWLAAQRALAAGLARWAAAMAAQGVVVTVGPAQADGFPLLARRRVALRLVSGGATVASEQVALSLSPTQPNRVLVTFAAPVRVQVPSVPPLVLASADWHLALPFDGAVVTTDARDLRLNVGGRQASIALLHLQGQRAADGLDLAGSAQSIALPEPARGEMLPLGRRLASVAFEAVLSGYLPPPPPGSAAWPDAPSLASWRDSGGAVAVRRLALGYGPLGLSGSGRLGLDAALQPRGAATLTLLGYAETLDALAAAHVLDAHAAMAAGAVLGLLARPPAGGGALQVTLQATLRDGVLTVAGFPLLRLPKLAWPTTSGGQG